MKPPWPVKIAAAVIALNLFANIIGVRGPSADMRFWFAQCVYEVIYVAIAYGLIRGSNVVRILWSIWTVAGNLIVFPMILAMGSFASVDTVILLATVALLFLPSSNKFFRKQSPPNQLSEPTPASGTAPAGQDPRHR
jgi:hypothetical protein